MSEHWYTADGKPCHTQPTKRGAKNAERPTNITDAKKLKLLPSVSSIIKMAHNPALERWKQSQIVKACYECPPSGDETLRDYEGYVLRMADKERNESAELGTRIHAGIEQYYTNDEASIDDDIKSYVFAAIDAVGSLHVKPYRHEIVVTCPAHGYAGTTDMIWSRPNGEVGILDFKSCKTHPDEPILIKQSHAAQIAAYQKAYWYPAEFKDNSMGYNIYISTTEPGRVEVVKHDAAKLKAEWEWFQACLTLWRHKYAYDPRTTDT